MSLELNMKADTSTAVVTQIATAMTIAPNAILIILTWVKTFGIHKALSEVGMRTPLTTLLIHDGTAYFMYDVHHAFLEPDRLLTPASAFCS